MESLARQLDAFMAGVAERADPALLAVLKRGTAKRAAAVAGTALGEGDTAPDFALPDQHGRTVSLHDALAAGPVVLTFFRGGWCPFCTLSLRALNAVAARLRRNGASVLAVSPQLAEPSRDTAVRNALDFPVLSDAGNLVAARYGLVTTLDAEEQAVYRRLGHDLPKVNGPAGWGLPVPAGYVIGPDGRIVRAVVDAAVTRRLEPADALATVEGMRAGVG